MMKQLKQIITTLIAIPAIAEASSDQDFKVINGSYKVSDTVVTEKLKINGEAVLGQGTVVKEMMVINGSLKAQGVKFEAELFANGNADIKQVRLQADAHFNGNLNASDSEFFKKFYALSQQSDYSNCQFKDIVIKKNPYINTKQIIRLMNNSIVNGDVIFESGKGEVYLDANSQIKGEVHGGRKIYS
jgi:hypothetical protein